MSRGYSATSRRQKTTDDSLKHRQPGYRGGATNYEFEMDDEENLSPRRRRHEEQADNIAIFTERVLFDESEQSDGFNDGPSNRRHRQAGSPLKIDDVRRQVAFESRAGPPSCYVQPGSPESEDSKQVYDREPSSVYSQDEKAPLGVSPLHITNRKTIEAQEDTAALLKSYGYLHEDPLPGSVSPSRQPTLHRAKSTHGMHTSKSRQNVSTIPIQLEPEPLYSPLTPYFADGKFPTMKRAGKVLIGDNGWLERPPPVTPEKKSKESPKKSGIMDSLRKIARDMVSQTDNSRFSG